MYKFLSRNGQLVTWIVGAVIVVAFFGTAFNAPDTLGPQIFKDGTTPLPASEILDKLVNIHYFDVGFFATYALLGLAVAATLLLSLFNFVRNFSMDSLKNMIPVLVILVVFFIAYSTYQPEISDAYAVKKARVDFEVGANASQIVSGGITAALFALGAAFVSLVVLELFNFVKSFIK